MGLGRGDRGILCLVVLLMMAAVTGAQAAEDPEALIHDGVELRRHGDDVKAHGYFQRAYDIGHTPRAAAQLGLVNQALGRSLEAERYLTEALDTQDPWVLSHRDILEKSRQVVRAQLGKIELRGVPVGATVTWANQPSQPVPTNDVLWVAPGQVTLTFAAPDRLPITKETSVRAGETLTLAIDLAPAAKPAAAAPAPASDAGAGAFPAADTPPSDAGTESGKSLRVAGLVTAGVGLAAGVAGVFFYRSGVDKAHAIEQGAQTSALYDESNGNYRARANTGIGLMVGGGVALVTGVVLYLVGRGNQSESTEATTHVSFGYTPGSGPHFALGGSF